MYRMAHFLGQWTDALATEASALDLLGRMDLLLVNVRQPQPEDYAADFWCDPRGACLASGLSPALWQSV